LQPFCLLLVFCGSWLFWKVNCGGGFCQLLLLCSSRGGSRVRKRGGRRRIDVVVDGGSDCCCSEVSGKMGATENVLFPLYAVWFCVVYVIFG
jgi:hypothetical protein